MMWVVVVFLHLAERKSHLCSTSYIIMLEMYIYTLHPYQKIAAPAIPDVALGHIGVSIIFRLLSPKLNPLPQL